MHEHGQGVEKLYMKERFNTTNKLHIWDVQKHNTMWLICTPGAQGAHCCLHYQSLRYVAHKQKITTHHTHVKL
jgi:hypothetical protein